MTRGVPVIRAFVLLCFRVLLGAPLFYRRNVNGMSASSSPGPDIALGPRRSRRPSIPLSTDSPDSHALIAAESLAPLNCDVSSS